MTSTDRVVGALTVAFAVGLILYGGFGVGGGVVYGVSLMGAFCSVNYFTWRNILRQNDAAGRKDVESPSKNPGPVVESKGHTRVAIPSVTEVTHVGRRYPIQFAALVLLMLVGITLSAIVVPTDLNLLVRAFIRLVILLLAAAPLTVWLRRRVSDARSA